VCATLFDTMARQKAGRNRRSSPREPDKPVALKDLAEYLGLAPATVSLVMNGSPVADTISKETKERIHAAARELGYRPNFLARCLRARRTFTIGVMIPEVSEGYNATVLSGIEDHLLQEGYFYFVASHRFQPDLIEEYPDIFLYRSVDGLIVLNAPWHRELPVPVVTISSHHKVKGAVSIVLDHRLAAELALRHLIELGHSKIAFIKGQAFTQDTDVRWKTIVKVAAELGIAISPKLVVQMDDNVPTSELGYQVAHKLLAAGAEFTALFAFNDISAIGAIRAFHERGMRIPDDVSVVGIDDIQGAAYQYPGLTTVRQPLREMGRLAAEIVLRRIGTARADRAAEEVVVEPELVVRGTTSILLGDRATRNRSREASASPLIVG
jgi:DNA-binding LacI/PurR family transcriptional regulator